MNTFEISIRPYGIHALLIEWPQRVDEAILNDILLFAQYLQTNCDIHPGWEMVTSYNSLTLIDRQKPLPFVALIPKLNQWYHAKKAATMPPRFLWKLPVCYDPVFGIDLLEVGNTLNMATADIVRLHTAQPYLVYGIGFLPGFMYLGGLPTGLEIPRRAQPRLQVVQGAVGIAGKQTGIYPQQSPGGWNIIGNCPVTLFDATLKDPCFVNVGDKVQFYKVERAEYDLRKIENEVGIYVPEKIGLHA